MTLPPRLPKKPKRDSRWRSPAHCNFVRSHACRVPMCDRRPIEVAHVRGSSGAGIAQKPDDFRTVSLCQYHHAEQHRIGEQTFWTEVAGRNPGELIEAFCKASPKSREIAAAKRERENG